MQEILTDSWLTSDPIDLEYKKYVMMAYHQKMMKLYYNKKLYPALTEIVDKITYVEDFLKTIKAFEDSALIIEDIDWIHHQLMYKSKITDDNVTIIKQIALMSKALLSDLYIRFKNLYDEVDGSICITGNRFSIFDKYDGYLRVLYDYGKKEKILYYDIYRVVYPYPEFHLRTSKASMKEYYEERFQKNIFDITINEPFPAKETSIPVFRRKFLLHVLGDYVV